jgi:uncharacterized protein (TIGR02145 family)
MKSITKLTLTATLALAITLTFNACEEKQAAKPATEPAALEAEAKAKAEAAAAVAAAEADRTARKPVFGTLTDTRDNKTYKTVKIGEQVWMAENLNYKTEDGSYCYDNDTSNCKEYGRLYDWETAKTACPNGWHLPDTTEWQILVDFAGGKNAVKALKATSGWNTLDGSSGNGTDDFGFSALPGGQMSCRDGCDFYNIGIRGDWWNIQIGYDDRVYIDEADRLDKVNGTSLGIRCIQN